MNSTDKQYLDVVRELLLSPEHVQGRNGGVTTHFGKQLVFENVGTSFPLLTTKRTHFKSIMVELLWFIKGLTTLDYLHKHNVSIWDEWANAEGELGPVYGKQWRSWPGKAEAHFSASQGGYVLHDYIDQLSKVIISIKEQPYGRRHLVTAWNPAEIDDMALPPCHCLFQFHVRSTGELDVQLYQRSADWFLGVPFNIASYALLLILVAREVGRTPGKLVHTFGNYHLYDNHREAAELQISRNSHSLPCVHINADPEVSLFELEPENIILINYKSEPAIKAEVSK